MSEPEALAPAELLSRTIEAALALSAAAVTTEMDGARLTAYERACGLTEAALAAAQALVQPAESPVLAQLVELSSELATRVAALEQLERASSND